MWDNKKLNQLGIANVFYSILSKNGLLACIYLLLFPPRISGCTTSLLIWNISAEIASKTFTSMASHFCTPVDAYKIKMPGTMKIRYLNSKFQFIFSFKFSIGNVAYKINQRNNKLMFLYSEIIIEIYKIKLVGKQLLSC